MLKKLDKSLPLAETSSLANVDLASRFYPACRGVPDYLMTLVRGAAAEAIWSAADPDGTPSPLSFSGAGGAAISGPSPGMREGNPKR